MFSQIFLLSLVIVHRRSSLMVEAIVICKSVNIDLNLFSIEKKSHSFLFKTQFDSRTARETIREGAGKKNEEQKTAENEKLLNELRLI